MSSCVLCESLGGTLLYQNDFIRIINPNEAYYPAFTRLVLQAHIREITDLSLADRHRVMDNVYAIETLQRQYLHPDKINLAQFGTQVPHLHWHIIPRFQWDLHYPASFWSPNTRSIEQVEQHPAWQAHLLAVTKYHQALKTHFNT